MKKAKKLDRATLEFLMQAKSLCELLSALKTACKNIDSDYVDSKSKSTKHMNFMLFGLIVRANSILEMMLFRFEPIKNNWPEPGMMYERLLKAQSELKAADRLIREKKMRECINKIEDISTDYSKTFEYIVKLGEAL